MALAFNEVITMFNKIFKFWGYAAFIFLQSQSYVTMANMFMNLLAVILASATLNQYLKNVPLPYIVTIFIVLIIAVVLTFAVGAFQYYVIFKHQYTATVNQAKEMQKSYEQIENIEKMLKVLINEKN
jgi:divalent metal cation (Fe/Co/Zn/Cd) transporter